MPGVVATCTAANTYMQIGCCSISQIKLIHTIQLYGVTSHTCITTSVDKRVPASHVAHRRTHIQYCMNKSPLIILACKTRYCTKIYVLNHTRRVHERTALLRGTLTDKVFMLNHECLQ